MQLGEYHLPNGDKVWINTTGNTFLGEIAHKVGRIVEEVLPCKISTLPGTKLNININAYRQMKFLDEMAAQNPEKLKKVKFTELEISDDPIQGILKPNNGVFSNTEPVLCTVLKCGDTETGKGKDIQRGPNYYNALIHYNGIALWVHVNHVDVMKKSLAAFFDQHQNQ